MFTTMIWRKFPRPCLELNAKQLWIAANSFLHNARRSPYQQRSPITRLLPSKEPRFLLPADWNLTCHVPKSRGMPNVRRTCSAVRALAAIGGISKTPLPFPRGQSLMDCSPQNRFLLPQETGLAKIISRTATPQVPSMPHGYGSFRSGGLG